MRSLPFSLSLAGFGLVAILSLHCGGRVDADSSNLCPTNITTASCASGAQCRQSYSDCNGSGMLTCSCESGSWKCPQLGPPACPNPCANAKNGVACGSEGLFCKDAVQPNCDHPTNDGCTCTNGKFSCSTTICSEPPPVPACPPPGSIVEGGKCSGNETCGGTLQCPKGNSVDVSFDCINGQWRMWEYFVDPCSTPDPDDGGIILVDAGSKG